MFYWSCRDNDGVGIFSLLFEISLSIIYLYISYNLLLKLNIDDELLVENNNISKELHHLYP